MRNIMVVFMVSGLWHGAAWTFVIWGALHGMYQVIGKLLKPVHAKMLDALHIRRDLKGFKLLRPLDDVARQKLCAVDPVLGAELADKLQGGLPAVALSSHPALNTAYLNDVSGDMMYAQQVNSLGKPGDVFLAITTSGTALNLRYAAVTAKAKGMKVLALTGKTGGAFNDLADINLVMPCNETYQIQELHLPVYHCLCLLLEDHFFGA
jgi:D-sedoheptulose 7-phosphate isomerase